VRTTLIRRFSVLVLLLGGMLVGLGLGRRERPAERLAASALALWVDEVTASHLGALRVTAARLDGLAARPIEVQVRALRDLAEAYPALGHLAVVDRAGVVLASVGDDALAPGTTDPLTGRRTALAQEAGSFELDGTRLGLGARVGEVAVIGELDLSSLAPPLRAAADTHLPVELRAGPAVLLAGASPVTVTAEANFDLHVGVAGGPGGTWLIVVGGLLAVMGAAGLARFLIP
jgi:hypothetical protein